MKTVSRIIDAKSPQSVCSTMVLPDEYEGTSRSKGAVMLSTASQTPMTIGRVEWLKQAMAAEGPELTNP